MNNIADTKVYLHFSKYLTIPGWKTCHSFIEKYQQYKYSEISLQGISIIVCIICFQMWWLLYIDTAFKRCSSYNSLPASFISKLCHAYLKSWWIEMLACSLHGPNPLPVNVQNSCAWCITAWTFGFSFILGFR